MMKEADFGRKKSYCRMCDAALHRELRAHMTEAKNGASNDGKAMAIFAFESKKRLGRKVDSQFDGIVKKKMALYRTDALDALHNLAMMPITENSAQNNIKLMAAAKLAQSQLDKESENQFDTYLKELNSSYQQAAPRIKEVRERVVTFDGGEVPPKVIN